MTLLALLYDCCDVLNVIDILNSIAHSGRRALAMPILAHAPWRLL